MARAKTVENEFTKYVTKPITKTMVEYHEWLEQQTGLDLDDRTVYLAATLRGAFQADNRSNGNGNGNGSKPAAKAAPKSAPKAAGPVKSARGRPGTNKTPAAKRGTPKSGRRGRPAETTEAPY